jgi:hypothetical protein
MAGEDGAFQVTRPQKLVQPLSFSCYMLLVVVSTKHYEYSRIHRSASATLYDQLFIGRDIF